LLKFSRSVHLHIVLAKLSNWGRTSFRWICGIRASGPCLRAALNLPSWLSDIGDRAAMCLPDIHSIDELKHFWCSLYIRKIGLFIGYWLVA